MTVTKLRDGTWENDRKGCCLWFALELFIGAVSDQTGVLADTHVHACIRLLGKALDTLR